jgi:adenylylsulfate kinase-like enzyme
MAVMSAGWMVIVSTRSTGRVIRRKFRTSTEAHRFVEKYRDAPASYIVEVWSRQAYIRGRPERIEGRQDGDEAGDRNKGEILPA